MVEFTPGPWRVDPKYPNDVQSNHARKVRLEIASTASSIYCDADCPDSDVRFANARLIAAAPDLLDALQKTLNAFELFMSAANWNASSLSAQTIRLANETPGIARAAIAKATQSARQHRGDV